MNTTDLKNMTAAQVRQLIRQEKIHGPTAGMAKERRRAAELPPESKGVTR